MKLKDILNNTRKHFTEKSGEIRLSGVTIDRSVAPKWINKQPFHPTIVTVRNSKDDLIDLKFSVTDDLIAVKYTHEGNNMFRRKL